jgi:SAM-dependent methyltransferase
MPYSYPEYKNEVKLHFKNTISSKSKVLDVGPGAGTYSDLLRELVGKLDCLEIWEPYIHQFNLSEKYDNVILGDIRSFDFSGYDYIIMGDVLEHLTTEDATIFLDRVNNLGIKCLVAVPYNYEQGEYEGNIYETHLQPDLTPENVLVRYPSLKLLYGNHFYGYYINYNNERLLTTIANKHTTDKGTVHYEAHGYTEVYGEYITDDKPYTLLEIGVWRGDSIRMWNEYNPNIKYHGIDIDTNVFNYLNKSEVCTIHIGNQSDKNFIDYIVNSIGDLDVVIDDGSHNHDDILNTFKYIFPTLKTGAIYFIEDLHAGHAEKDRLICNLMLAISHDGLKFTDCKFFCDQKLLMFVV